MKRIAVVLLILVIACLNGIILWSCAASGGPAIGNITLGALVLIMDLGLVTSSLLLTYVFWREGRSIWAALFAINLLMMAGAVAIRARGATIIPAILFAADLYWLQLYLACLLREWHWLFQRSARNAIAQNRV